MDSGTSWNVEYREAVAAVAAPPFAVLGALSGAGDYCQCLVIGFEHG
jgi:hypothetical protein